ncbi:hypothetical protein BDP81DRAFT_390122 [Colletotrichum phormii]|uniref:Uncharacterized protein n=1 Tax=Colletotrichum phormii TaxID=359342 RepID=A0AAJ0A286_9PEZI|nr:uncharacterized protein BDP81DRAFT_390122 [Colletotrichum phormii]KAK1655137.1 hypothetical protein BDP81DRAFT_390122 [Colletotrichum phormii]
MRVIALAAAALAFGMPISAGVCAAFGDPFFALFKVFEEERDNENYSQQA